MEMRDDAEGEEMRMDDEEGAPLRIVQMARLGALALRGGTRLMAWFVRVWSLSERSRAEHSRGAQAHVVVFEMMMRDGCVVWCLWMAVCIYWISVPVGYLRTNR